MRKPQSLFRVLASLLEAAGEGGGRGCAEQAAARSCSRQKKNNNNADLRLGFLARGEGRGSMPWGGRVQGRVLVKGLGGG